MAADDRRSSKSKHGDKPKKRAGAITRLGEIAREVGDLGRALRSADTPGDPAGPSAEDLRRIEVLSAMLARETGRAAGQPPPPPSAPPTIAPLPFISSNSDGDLTLGTDDYSITVGEDGFEGKAGDASVSVGSDGASAENGDASVSVDSEGVTAKAGDGEVKAGKDGISASNGKAGVSIGPGGASVQLPWGGEIRIGADGSVSADPGTGKGPGGSGGVGLPLPPIPCIESCEFKIPIPVPKIVAEPFEIAIGIPKVETHPVSFPLPTPTPTPWPFPVAWPQLPPFPNLPDIRFPDVVATPTPMGPIPIPYPTIGGLVPGIPGPGGSGYNAGIEGLITTLLKASMADVKDELKDVTRRVKDWDEALGDQAAALVQETRQLAEAIDELWRQARESIVSMHEQLAATYGFVNDAVRAIAATLRASLGAVLNLLGKLMKLQRDIARKHLELAVGALSDVFNPVGVVLDVIRHIYTIVNWIATRAFSIVGFTNDLFEKIVEVGSRLDEALARAD